MMQKQTSGFFVTFEGGEGAGKTTQIRLLADRLKSAGHGVIMTREPGGVPEAEKLRALLVDQDGGDWDALSECLLLFAGRRMHIEKLIKPAMAEGKIILCDRFTDSTIAYQGYGHEFDLHKILEIQSLAIGDFKPDLTFILDLPVETGLARAGHRAAATQSREIKNEQRPPDFHERLRNGFLTIAAQEQDRCRVIDATLPVTTIAEDILQIFEERYGRIV